TLWYVGVLAGVLALYVASTLLFLDAFLRRELDEALHAEFERAEDLLAVGPDGVMRMGGHGDEGGDESLVEVGAGQGGLLYRSEALGPRALGDAPGASGSACSSSVLRDGPPVRVLTRVHAVGDRDAVVRVAVSEERQRKQWRDLLLGLLLSLPA